MSLSINGLDITKAKREGLLQQKDSASNRLLELEALIIKCDERNKKLEEEMTKQAELPEAKADWTKSYSFWSQWEDVEELKTVQSAEESSFEALSARPDFMGHYHDHSNERGIFYKPEAEKMAFCERHRRKGNALFHEGLFPKAAEQYQIALSYYEYCFPDSDADQAHLDSVRHACLCNISLSYYRMGFYKQAVESANLVLSEDARNAKAHFRRAQAYRMMDKFSEAAADLRAALSICPSDPGIAKEFSVLMEQKRKTALIDQAAAQRMLGITNPPAGPITNVLTRGANVSEVVSEEDHMDLSIFSDTLFSSVDLSFETKLFSGSGLGNENGMLEPKLTVEVEKILSDYQCRK